MFCFVTSCHLPFCCPQSSILALVLTVTTSAKRWKQLCKLRAPSINRAPCTEYKREFKSAKCATAQCIKSHAKFCRTIVKGCLSAQQPLPEPIWTQLQIDFQQPKKAGEKWDWEQKKGQNRAENLSAHQTFLQLPVWRCLWSFASSLKLIYCYTNLMEGLQRAHSNGDDNSAVQENQCRLVPRNHSHGLK